jgi:hypothetical protein
VQIRNNNGWGTGMIGRAMRWKSVSALTEPSRLRYNQPFPSRSVARIDTGTGYLTGRRLRVYSGDRLIVRDDDQTPNPKHEGRTYASYQHC